MLKVSIIDGATVVVSGNTWGSKTGTTPFKGLVNGTAGGDNVLDSNPAN